MDKEPMSKYGIVIRFNNHLFADCFIDPIININTRDGELIIDNGIHKYNYEIEGIESVSFYKI
jgi:hypothetical protein